MIRDTSYITYNQIIDEGLLQKCQEKVFSFVKYHPYTYDRAIAMGTGLEINNVCGRRNKLVEIGLILDAGLGVSPGGRSVHLWKLNPMPELAVENGRLVPIQKTLGCFA